MENPIQRGDLPRDITQEETNFQKQVGYFDRQYHDIIVNARGTAFGMIMTIVDTLGLQDKQFRAVKSLIARDIDTVMFDILDRDLMEVLLRCFDYSRKFGDSVVPLAEPVSSDKE